MTERLNSSNSEYLQVPRICKRSGASRDKSGIVIINTLAYLLNPRTRSSSRVVVHTTVKIIPAKLVIRPGFTTSIFLYENSIMLCTDVSHEVLQSETALDSVSNLHHQTEEQKFQE
ncbi:hypothetical protein MG293_000010 [Ovis ammon polii]|uniref:Uncharacterized protein n=1 Tax=Ovis ammon polii TaxID=230172 RepID=A0AAD4UP75_OVIAM|nr:hypothetical protein MG293_000010 [Ovis ammon polii]